MNELFLERMREMLKDEYPAYLDRLNDPARKGLRINTLKITPDDFFACTNYELEKKSICEAWILRKYQKWCWFYTRTYGWILLYSRT